MINISFIICTYNRDKYIATCLECLKNQSAAKESYEIVIINNNCTDSSPQLIEKFIHENAHLQIQYHIEEKPGLSHARNKGLRVAKGKMLCFIDDDGFVEEQYTSNLLEYMQNIKDLSSFGGKISPLFETEKPKWMSKYLMPLISALDMGTKVKLFQQNKYPIGANMGISSTFAKQVGDFDINLGRSGTNLLGGEEKDYFLRLKKLNAKTYYLPNCAIKHVIPPHRIQLDFIKKLALGIGESEHRRAKAHGEYLKSLLKELLKWGATFILGFAYIFQSPTKSLMLFRFRYWVSKGLLKFD